MKEKKRAHDCETKSPLFLIYWGSRQWHSIKVLTSVLSDCLQGITVAWLSFKKTHSLDVEYATWLPMFNIADCSDQRIRIYTDLSKSHFSIN